MRCLQHEAYRHNTLTTQQMNTSYRTRASAMRVSEFSANVRHRGRKHLVNKAPRASAWSKVSLASCLHSDCSMNQNIKLRTVTAPLAATLSLIFFSSTCLAFVIDLTQQQSVLSARDKEIVATFEKRVKEYVRLRDQVKQKVPKLAKDSTPEQIQAGEKAFVEALRVARAGAKPGDIFTAKIAEHIRTTLKTEFKPADKKEIRKIVLGTDTRGVPLRVNYPYPDPKEFSEMPPTLLLKLPLLPKQVKYRYVGRNLMLVDTDNNLIIDYMLDGLP